MSAVEFAPGCVGIGGGVIACGPGGVVIQSHGRCLGLCARADARLLVREPNSPWWGADIRCECGDSWSDGELHGRPFRKGWRTAAQATFEAEWITALPEGTQALREWRDGEDLGYLTGVRLPDGTVVPR